MHTHFTEGAVVVVW